MNHRTKASHILIMEPNVSGHRGAYLQWMTEGLAERGFTITIMTFPESLKHPSLQKFTGEIEDNVTVIPGKYANSIPNNYDGAAASLIRREFAYWKIFRKWCQWQRERARVDAVLLPYFDYCLYAVALLGTPFGKLPFVGVAMRPSFHYPKMGIISPSNSLGAVKNVLFLRLLGNKHLKHLLSIDEPLIEYVRDQNKAASEKIVFLPEPSDLEESIDANEAKQKLGVNLDQKLILVYGALSSRKGVIELLRSVSDFAYQKNVGVVLAGKIQDELLSHLDAHWIKALQQDGRLIILNNFVSEEEEIILFSAADIVWLGYREHYTASGVLVQAACAGLPVIACKEGLIGWQTRRHKLGIDLNPTDNISIAEAIAKLTEEEDFASDTINSRKGFENRDISRSQDILANCFE